MSEMLRSGQKVQGRSSGTSCEVQQFLGGGGQGEVYQVNVGSTPMALKWYFPHYLQQDPELRQRLEKAINTGAPNNKFLWPIELTASDGSSSFGYLMTLRERRYKGIVDMMKRRVEPSFYALATAGFQLADSYWQLHAKGMCYRDISFGNVFFDPDRGDVLICDNDNVDFDGIGKGGVLGTPRFMAPELVRGDKNVYPSTQTDRFSLAVLLFYMLMMHHPLEGAKEAAIHAFDLPAMTRLYGKEPIFIYDPDNDTNRPVSGFHDNAIEFWKIYPLFLRNLFIKAFTVGIRDPQHGRIGETQWRQAMIRLRDSILYCANCTYENFYDAEAIQAAGKPGTCWNCKKELRLPPRIRVGKDVVMLNHDSQLFLHHVDDTNRYNIERAVAAVNRHPTNPNVWGLKNLSEERWVTATPDGAIKEVEPGRSVTLVVGTKINFGKLEGEIRL